MGRRKGEEEWEESKWGGGAEEDVEEKVGREEGK